MIHTMNETFDTRAAAKRDRILDEFATPKGEPNVGTDENGATISAQGVYAPLNGPTSNGSKVGFLTPTTPIQKSWSVGNWRGRTGSTSTAV